MGNKKDDQKAVRLYLAPQDVSDPGEAIRLAIKALQVNNILKLCVRKGMVKIPGTKMTRCPGVVVQIPRRRFEKARYDGRLEQLLKYRAMTRAGWLRVCPTGEISLAA